MAEATESGPAQAIPALPPPAPKPESTPTDVVLRVLGAIGTGIGILGFVAFFGAAILWVRADKAELPATEAVAAIPRNVLISTGAQFLFPALLYAVGLVALVFIVHFVPKSAQIWKSREEREKITTETLGAADLGRRALIAQQDWKAAVAALDALREDLNRAHERKGTGVEISAIEHQLRTQSEKTARLEARAEKATSKAAEAKAGVDTKVEKAAAKLERKPGEWIAEIIAVALSLALVVIIDGSLGRVSCGQVVVLLALAVSGAIIAISVYWASENFVWFGVMAFVVVGIYLGAATYFNTHNNAKMQPVAVLRSGHDPVAAAFIASTSENVYVGTFREKETPPRLLIIPRSQVVELAVGPLLEQRRARHRALAMALNECAQTIKDPTATPPTTTPPPAKESTPETRGKNVKPGQKGNEQQPGYAAACTPPQEEKLETALKRGSQAG
jgi:hypothetical protein